MVRRFVGLTPSARRHSLLLAFDASRCKSLVNVTHSCKFGPRFTLLRRHAQWHGVLMTPLRFHRALSATAVAVAFLFSSTVTAQQNPLLRRHVPEIVTNGQASPTGPVESSRHLQLALSLPLRNEATLDTLLQQIYDPQSPNFHHYLTAQQFTDSFEPSQKDYDAVVQWAKAK